MNVYEAAFPELHARIEVFGPWHEVWLPSIVEDEVNGVLQVAVPNAPGSIVPVVAQPGDRVTLHWVSARGAAEVDCRIQGIARNALASWLLQPLGAPIVRQRRAYVRAEVHMPLSLVPDLGEPARRGWAVDLSEGGVRCVTPVGELGAGHRPLVELDVEGEMILTQAEILRVAQEREGYATVALKFLNLHHRDADRIRRYVFDAQLRLPVRRK